MHRLEVGKRPQVFRVHRSVHPQGHAAGGVPAQWRWTTRDDIENGRWIFVVDVAPIRPAEFVIFRVRARRGCCFSQRADTLGVMARQQRPRASPARSYSIYIIELSRACVKKPCALAPLYVGQTAHTPEERFAQHKAGGKLAASKAHKFGLRLRLDLMKGIGPFSTRKEAETAEKNVAEALARRGHKVFWG